MASNVFSEALKKREVKAKAFDAEGNEVQVRHCAADCAALNQCGGNEWSGASRPRPRR